MTKEPTHADIPEDDNEPATKGDVRKSQEELAGMMATSFQGVTDDISGLKQDVTGLKKDVTGLKQDMSTLKDTVKLVLDIVKTVDKNTRGIPAQIERLNARVFPRR